MDYENPFDALFEALAGVHLDDVVASYVVLAAMERLDSYFQQISIRTNGKSPLAKSHVRLIILKKHLQEHLRQEIDSLVEAEEFLNAKGD